MQDSQQAFVHTMKANLSMVLLVEDDQFVREMCGAKLRANGYRLMEAATGDDALLILQGGGVDVLVTDICMPGALDGWSLAEKARLLQPRTAVVYASSRPADADRQVSGSIYLRKPYRPDAIVAAVEELTSL